MTIQKHHFQEDFFFLEMFYLRLGLMDGVSKVSFNFLYTLWVYRSCICILIYIVKSCHQHSYGFQNSMSSWGVGVRFSNLPFSHDFLKIMPKVRCFKNTNDNRPFLNIFSNLSKILIFSEISFTGISFVKLTLSSYFLAKFWDFQTFV